MQDNNQEEDVRNKPMATEDKVLLAILAVAVVGLLYLARWVMVGFFDMTAGASTGIGFREAFIASLVISVVIIVLFALVGGDGILGEFVSMIIGFFVMVVFFTISIAVIL